jgi:hypothetical protein
MKLLEMTEISDAFREMYNVIHQLEEIRMAIPANLKSTTDHDESGKIEDISHSVRILFERDADPTIMVTRLRLST